MLQQNMPESIRGQVRRLHELPPPSQSAQHLLEALRDDDVCLDALAAAIEACPPIAARVVGLANSAYFNPHGAVRSVADAIIRVLGLDLVRNLALGLALTGAFEPERCRSFSPAQYWGSALLTGQLARDLARRCSLDELSQRFEEAYLCGLLHNIGLLALAHVAPREMEQALARAAQDPDQPLSVIELEQLGVHHCHVGAWLATRWHLPGAIATVINHHHDLDYRAEHWPLVVLVGLCTQWARQRLAGMPAAWAESKESRALGLSETLVRQSLEHCESQIGEVTELAKLFARGR